jgi:aminomuconate-semialdehyde/2-hydroxymuconate-6-semialdehyde dehydrogenase
MFEIRNYINGELRAPKSGKYLDNFEPATGAVYAKIPESDEADINDAIEAAAAAFPSWSNLKNEERGAW